MRLHTRNRTQSFLSRWRKLVLFCCIITAIVTYFWLFFPMLRTFIFVRESNSPTPNKVVVGFELLAPSSPSTTSTVEMNVKSKTTTQFNNQVETISRILPIPDYPVENSSRITYPIILEEQKPRIVKSQFPTPQSFSSVSKNRLKSVLVVCGTDGSGTRRVVQILTELGVTMVSEDPETYDIHADIVGGWPPIVSPVLAAARSLNYDPDRLPKELSITISRSLKSLLDLARWDSKKPQSKVLAVGGALRKPRGTNASRVDFGFKAPVAMTLAPWWAKMLPHFQLLHVLRDGRDIAFSVNQGPVEKFYRVMYGSADHGVGSPLKAIRLWSDWNSQIYRWAEKHSKSLDGSSDRSFGYLALHSEDLVSRSSSVRFAAIRDLARFVGSSLSEREICCLAKKGTEFMGSHDRTPKQKQNSENQVTSRYGKWRTLVAGNQVLSNEMYRLGGEGLRVFGYEPLRELPDDNMVTENGFSCEITAEECGFNAPSAPVEAAVKPDEWIVPGKCSAVVDVDFFGGDISAFVMDGDDNALCCRQCLATVSCKHFTIDTASRTCYLKFSHASSNTKIGLVSGSVL